ncbi:hypothetical protein M413DRAFT_444388 [Hebeloma cylindrosporum]|uniref:Uncharacterized protein n=1 Tax=Hebeloma cylindrosporum TaxID=76867 RepID=A0A0C2XYM2_HEBCY|nr:hypothetical protein M413DRAFT_444388 [Hebeloma cylindrosporum h7]
MPYLTPEALSPASKTVRTESNGRTGMYLFEDSVLDPGSTNAGKNSGGISEEEISNAYPVVRLDVERITDAIAGRLATSLLAHVLFLKNQVPFPVMQLGKIPGGNTSSRASKQRAELLASFDTISSHLDTTFSALSTALARCTNNQGRKLAQAHFAILVGPSIGTAKSKLIVGIDGLEARIWGSESGSTLSGADESDEEEADESQEDEDEEGGDSEEEPADSEDEDEELEDNEDQDEDGEQDEEDEEDEQDYSRVQSPPPPYLSRAEEQKFLQNADRLLARTLAAADAAGNGITSEMSPTQTHILIRAPRGFSHPAWIPRQNLTSSLDSSLQEFLGFSGLRDAGPEPNPSSKISRRSKVEGVWIAARSGIQPLRNVQARPGGPSKPQEDEDMIWWSWDGKFVGFADW